MTDKHPLGRLITRVQETQGWSDRDLAERSAPSHPLSKTRVGDLKNKPVTSIKARTIRTLAYALNVPERLVAEAALESMGIELRLDRPAEVMDVLAADATLSARDRFLIGTLLEQMRLSAAKDWQPDEPGTLAEATRLQERADSAPAQTLEDLAADTSPREDPDAR